MRVNSVYTYGIKNFGEKMAFLEQNRLKTGKNADSVYTYGFILGVLRCFGWKVRDFLWEIKFRNKCTETGLCYSAEKYCETI